MNGFIGALLASVFLSPPPIPANAPPRLPIPFDYETHSIYGCVNDCALSPDGKRLLIGGQFGFGYGGWALWDLHTGKELVSTRMTKRKAGCVAFSSDGKHVAAGGNGGELQVFDAATGKSLVKLDGHRACLLHVAFTPNGKYLVSLGDDNMLRIWSAGKYRPAATFSFTSPVFDRNRWKKYPEEDHEKAPMEYPASGLQPRRQVFALRQYRRRCKALGGRHRQTGRPPGERRSRGSRRVLAWRRNVLRGSWR